MTNNVNENVKDYVIEFQDVGCRISGKEILIGITLNVKRGEIMGLLGKNGAGKTTLISHISMLRRQISGEIIVLGKIPAHTAQFRKKWVLSFRKMRFTKN